MRIKALITGISILFSLGIIVMAWTLSSPRTHTIGYVDMAKLYSDFPMTKEYQIKYKNLIDFQETIKDSLKLELNRLNNQLEKRSGEINVETEFEHLRNNYLSQVDQFRSQNTSLSDEYNNQIWEQINQYVRDYGAANGYDFILGANGTGSLMYASNSGDVTDAVKEYINERYNGVQK